MKTLLQVRKYKIVKYGLFLGTAIFAMVLLTLILIPSSSKFDLKALSESCNVPCWEGIVPGKTNEQTSLMIITDPKLVEQNSIKSSVDQNDPKSSGYMYRRTDGGSGSIGLYDNTVVRIDIRPGPPLPLFNDVIGVFGYPDIVQIDSKTSEGVCYDVHLYYLSQGILVRGGGCNSSNEQFIISLEDSEKQKIANVHSDIPVSSLTFFEAGQSLEEIANTFGLLSNEPTYKTISNGNSWEGFGFYPILPNNRNE